MPVRPIAATAPKDQNKMHTLHRLLMAGTILSGFAWLHAAEAGTANGEGAQGKRASVDASAILLAQAPPPETKPGAAPAGPPGAKPPARPAPPAARPAPPPQPPAARPGPLRHRHLRHGRRLLRSHRERHHRQLLHDRRPRYLVGEF